MCRSIQGWQTSAVISELISNIASGFSIPGKHFLFFYPKHCKKAMFGKWFWFIECCFQTSKTDPTEKAKNKDMTRIKTSSIGDSLILLQINSLYTNGPEKQVVVCCDNFSPLAEVTYFSPVRFNKL